MKLNLLHFHNLSDRQILVNSLSVTVNFFLSLSVYGQTNRFAEKHLCMGVCENNVAWAVGKSNFNNQSKLNDNANKILYDFTYNII